MCEHPPGGYPNTRRTHVYALAEFASWTTSVPVRFASHISLSSPELIFPPSPTSYPKARAVRHQRSTSSKRVMPSSSCIASSVCSLSAAIIPTQPLPFSRLSLKIPLRKPHPIQQDIPLLERHTLLVGTRLQVRYTDRVCLPWVVREGREVVGSGGEVRDEVEEDTAAANAVLSPVYNVRRSECEIGGLWVGK